MRHAAIYIVSLTLAIVGAQTSSAQIAWEGKLRDAHTKAKQQGKLILLHFYTDNCVYCDRLEAGAFRSDSVSQSINQHFVPVKVHGGKNPQLAKMFKVTKYPTDVIVTTEGKALSHSVSPQQPDRYISMLTDAQLSYAKTRTQLAAQPVPAATTTPQAPSAAKPSAGLGTPESAPQVASNQLPVQMPSYARENSAADLAAASVATPDTGSSRPNQFVMPGGAQPNPTNTSLASARTTTNGGFTLPPGPAITPQSDSPELASDQNQTATPDPVAKPELAIEGYCVVSVVNRGEWVEGKPELGVIHLGRLYLFADKASMDLFLSDPIPFTPMLNEIDVVRFFEEKKIVKGKREWGVIDPIHNRMFFFADEAAMLHFEKSFDRYLDAAIEVMDQAINESNPGV